MKEMRTFLFDGYLIIHVDNSRNLWMTGDFLFDGYLINAMKNGKWRNENE